MTDRQSHFHSRYNDITFISLRRFYVPIIALTTFLAAAPASVTYKADKTVNGTTETFTGQTFSTNELDTSGFWVTNSGILTLTNCTVTTTGNTSSAENSNSYDLNAGILVTSAGRVSISGGSVTTKGRGASGIFVHGAGSSADISNATITTSGKNAPGIYSMGNITINGATVSAGGSEAAVIEGQNALTLQNTALSGTVKRGVMIYQSGSGDVPGATGTFTMTAGSLSAAAGPLFYVTNGTGVITLAGTTVNAPSGTLVEAAAGEWGTSGSNGGTVTFTANGETLTGDLTADNISTITALLIAGTTLTGKVTRTALTVDPSSSWKITANSSLIDLTNSGTVAFNAVGLTGSVSGNYTQSTTGTLAIKLGGSSSFDQITITGTASLDGTLKVEVVNGYTPPAGKTFKILTYGKKSGVFSAKTASASSLNYIMEYYPTYAQIKITSKPGGTDIDNSGSGADPTPTPATTLTPTPTITPSTTPEPTATPTPSAPSTGLCGSGIVALLPFTFFGLAEMKWNIRRRK